MVSVVLTSFNYASLLPRAIEAILRQSIQPSEFIIIDDDSTDGSFKIIEEYAKGHSCIKVVRNDRNKGVIWSINHGLEIANNPYILFATADDFIFPTLIEESLVLLKRYPQAGFFTASATFIDIEGRQIGLWRDLGAPRKEFVDQVNAKKRMRRYGFWFVGAVTVFRRELLIEAGGFNPELGHFCDSFITQVLALRHGYCYKSEPLSAIRTLGSSYSQSIRCDAQKEQVFRNNVISLMKSVYSDLFPADFIDEWDKVNKLMSAFYVWRADVLNNQMLFLKEKMPIFRPTPNWEDTFFQLILRAFSWIQFFIFMVYAAILWGRGRLFMEYISVGRFKDWMTR